MWCRPGSSGSACVATVLVAIQAVVELCALGFFLSIPLLRRGRGCSSMTTAWFCTCAWWQRHTLCPSLLSFFHPLNGGCCGSVRQNNHHCLPWAKVGPHFGLSKSRRSPKAIVGMTPAWRRKILFTFPINSKNLCICVCSTRLPLPIKMNPNNYVDS